MGEQDRSLHASGGYTPFRADITDALGAESARSRSLSRPMMIRLIWPKSLTRKTRLETGAAFDLVSTHNRDLADGVV